MPPSIIMNMQSKKISDLGKREVETANSQNFPARCGDCEIAGSPPPSSSDCYNIGTWNVRSLYQQEKLACVIQEMAKLSLGILGISETFWPDEGEFKSSIPTLEETYKVIYSGGKRHRRGVGFIMNSEVAKTVLYYIAKSERTMCLKIKAKHHKIVSIQVYAPNESAEEAGKAQFYEELRETIKEHKKSKDQLIVMGDFNAKVGEKRENAVVGPFGMGERYGNGELLLDFCKEEDLVLANGDRLKQVKEYNYLGSLIDEDMRSIGDVKRRIGMGKTAFWKCKELFRRDINIDLKKRMLDCYVKSIMSYGSETWTYSKIVQNKIDAFQLWCYRRMLKIRYTDHVTNTRVKEIIGVERSWSEDLARRKLRYAGHIMRGSSGGLVQLVLEGYMVTLKGRKDGADREEYAVTTLKNGPTVEPWEWLKDCLKINLLGRTWCTTFEFEEVTLID